MFFIRIIAIGIFITFLSHGAVLCVEAVCVFVCMHVYVCELGTLGCVGRVG